MIELTQGEMIQILRKRAGRNQGQLGAEAFNTTPDSGRTKIKNSIIKSLYRNPFSSIFDFTV